jgi:hypothetical protein
MTGLMRIADVVIAVGAAVKKVWQQNCQWSQHKEITL